ncbi:MAG TPA: orotidine 5'-phosphate decarboxylase / HUMPS family protein [Vicinamibacteria bacterium]|nr:orotidine 5'-phosphate decarboxylase / HUMPS family protein [Vicinamibacteria bacterium]
MAGAVTTQVSLDVTTIAEALSLAHGARRAGIDWLEAGTPLILGEGLHAVAALRREFPGVPIVADLKTMDGAGLEAEMMLGAGATHVVVMSRAHWASVAEMVRVAHAMGGFVMADVLGAEDKAADARAMQDLGADWIILHTGFDERRHLRGVSPLDDLDRVVAAVERPVQAVGGLSIEQALETARRGARSVVIGAPLAIQADRFASGDEFEAVLRDVVTRVRALPAASA